MTQIHWANPVSADFSTAADWSSNSVPGTGDDAILDAAGATSYTVTAPASETVHSIQTAVTATLAITAGTFTASAGTGGGVNAGLIAVGNGANLSVGGTIDNTGAITMSPGAQGAQISIGGAGVTLVGGGAITSTNNGASGGFLVGGVLTNVDNTLSGSIAYSGPELINESKGVIDSTLVSMITGMITGGPGPVTIINAGLIEATAVNSVIDIGLGHGGDVVDNSSGGVLFAGNGAAVVLETTVIGGTLKTAGTGAIYTGATTLDGRASAVNDSALVVQRTNSVLTIEGAINNSGTIKFTGESNPGPPTIIVGAGGATLAGGGLITLIGNAGDLITGATAGVVLTNVDNTIRGAGLIGAGSMTLINEAKGKIVGSTVNALIIDTGSKTISNAGLIEATGAGGVTIASAIANTGMLEAAGGTITVSGAVSGKGGIGEINTGTLDFASTFNQKVAFTGASGVLELARSQAYHASITGFSSTGGTSLDLVDIAFVSSTEATFSGTKTSGFLTVTDGTHTARIHLIGNYQASTFVASSDGHGGVSIVDPPKAAGAPPHQFIAAMAGLVVSKAGAAIHTIDAGAVHQPMLSGPRTAIV